MPQLLLIRGDSYPWPGRRTAITREIIENTPTPASFIPHSFQSLGLHLLKASLTDLLGRL